MLPLLLLFAALLMLTAVAAYTDLKSGEIPNRLIVIGLASALPLQAAVHYYALPAGDVSDALLTALGHYALGFVVCGLAPLVLFRLDAMGGGDVKLLLAVGAFVGPMRGIEIQLYAFVLMSIYAGARLAYKGQLLRLLVNSALLAKSPFVSKEKRRPVPSELFTSLRFAPAVFAATALILGMQLTFDRLGLQ
jgi:prepilin peptidase CpaA